MSRQQAKSLKAKDPKLLGEALITNHFEVIPISKKRKGEVNYIPNRKRRKPDAGEASTHSASIQPFVTASTTLARHVDIHGISSDNPSTPAFKKKPSQLMSLQAPPATLETFSRRTRLVDIVAGSPPSTSKLERSTTIIKKPSESLPTPTTTLPSRTRSVSGTHCHTNGTPSKTATLQSSVALLTNEQSGPLRTTSFGPISAREIVPSSQSQVKVDINLHDSSVSPSSDLIHKELSFIKGSSTPRKHVQVFKIPEDAFKLHSISDYGFTIGSSQSQYLSPFDQSPLKRRLNADNMISKLHLRESFDSIPSSQKQENEMELVNTRILSPPELTSDQPSSSGWSYIDSRTPNRTLSDELFSVPIQTSVLAGIFREGEEHENVPPSKAVSEGSVTESETEDESPPSRPSELPRLQMATPRFHSPLHDPPCNVPHGDLQDRESSPSHEFSDSLEETSSLSLPSVLQEFQEMFGSNDESYPPDFPMSLRS